MVEGAAGEIFGASRHHRRKICHICANIKMLWAQSIMTSHMPHVLPGSTNKTCLGGQCSMLN
jgi:hypothetical protein